MFTINPFLYVLTVLSGIITSPFFKPSVGVVGVTGVTGVDGFGS